MVSTLLIYNMWRNVAGESTSIGRKSLAPGAGDQAGPAATVRPLGSRGSSADLPLAIIQPILLMPIAFLIVLVQALTSTSMPADYPDPEPEPIAAQGAFFENLRSLCGQTFGGRTIVAEATDRTFEPARLFMVVEQCHDDEIRVPFIVDGDASRTWVFRMRDEGLTFFHEHLREDGTPYETSGFGGHASADGTAIFQSFPDFWATEETPPELHRTWRIRFDYDHDLFVYYLQRGDRLAYRLVFHMGAPSPPPGQP
jgi:hypothetical protein